MTTDRAVSDVLGYVLVIGIVTMMIATVMTLGVAALYDAQAAEQTNNMERAFDVVADNFEQMYADGAPSRSTEIRLLQGHIRYDDPVEINVTIDGDVVGNLTVETYPIVYDNEEGTIIGYEAGAVIRQQQDTSVMLSEPPLWIGEDRMVVPMVRTRALSGTPERQNGPGTVMARGDGLRSSRESEEVNETDEGDIAITVRSPRTAAWEAYFDGLDVEGADLEVTEDYVRLRFNRDPGYAVTVIRQRIRISLQD